MAFKFNLIHRIFCGAMVCATGLGGQIAESWETLETVGLPSPRHEAGMVALDGKLYLLGGRRIQPVDVFSVEKKRWEARTPPPLELHHFQPVGYAGEIWALGAMTGRFPDETPVPSILIYDPAEDTWRTGWDIPKNRRRGGAGTVVHAGDFYLVGGIQRGHRGGFVPWLDRLDPKSGEWAVLPDAPHARDHFTAVVIENKLYAAGGRRTSKDTNQVFELVVPAVDVFDFSTQEWSTIPDPLPTPRAGTMAVGWKEWLIIAGGESGAQRTAHAEVEAYNTKTGKWYTWPAMKRGRHGSGLALVDGCLYCAAGSGNRGGSPELDSTEVLPLEE